MKVKVYPWPIYLSERCGVRVLGGRGVEEEEEERWCLEVPALAPFFFSWKLPSEREREPGPWASGMAMERPAKKYRDRERYGIWEEKRGGSICVCACVCVFF